MCIHRMLIKTFTALNELFDRRRLAKKVPVEGVDVLSDIPYAEDGHPMHTLDVYRPQNAQGTLPIIVDIHGGGWVYGTKDINKHYCMGLAKQGFVVFNINYRLIKAGHGGQYPNLFKDVFSAFEWIFDHAEDYGADRQRAVLTGDSAGAHIACYSALVNGQNNTHDHTFSTRLPFHALALTCGVSDLTKYTQSKLPLFRYLLKLYLGKGWKKLPVLQTLTLKNMDLSVLPPVFLNTSESDFMKRDVFAFAEELQNRGVKTELVYFENPPEYKLTHVYNVLYPEWKESEETNRKMLDFFTEHLKKSAVEND